jgi:hypothetical protein
MPATLTSIIEAALAGDGINCIDILRVKLPGRPLYISKGKVPERFTGEGVTYEPIIKSIGPLTFKAGFQDSTVSITFVNPDLVKQLSDEGVIWDRAEVSLCRLFPDLDPPDNRVGTWDAPYWRGWVKRAPSFEDVSTMKVSSGFNEMNRPALRRFGRTDMSDLGSEQFPYNPLAGKGLPQIKASGTVTAGSTSSLTASPSEVTSLQESWLIFVKVKKIIGRIVSINSTTGQVEVEYWLHGGDNAGAVVPVSGDSWIAGPAYTSYDGMESSCKNMGMFGPHAGQDENSLNTFERRCFKALSSTGNAYLEKAAPVSSLANSLFSSVEGEGKDGDVIPVRFGRGESDLIVLASGQAGKYIHILGTIGEGRVAYLGEPLLDGVYHVDNINPAADANDDSWIEGGTDWLSANDASAVTSGELTESQQNQAVGSRQARARNHDETLDTHKSNPLGFNGEYGDGCSLDGLSWVRGRWEIDGYDLSGEPLVKIRWKGVITKAPDGSWVNQPNLMEAAYYYLVNNRWGVKLDDDRLNLDDFLTESTYAGEVISSTGSEPKIQEGTVVAGPEDATAPTLPPCCLIVPASLPLGETREDGLTCTVTTATKTYTMTVRGEATETGPTITSWIRTPEGETRSAVIQNEGWLLTFYENFDAEIPEAGDTFILSGAGLTEEGAVRYKAGGSLAVDKSYGKLFEDIMRCCNGSYVQKRGKISPVIRRAVDLSVVNTRRLYTDTGSGRNVLKGTMKCIPLDTSEIPTSIYVEFVDTEHGYQKRQIPIRNIYAEERIKALTGALASDKSIEVLDQPLTPTADQAIRIGVLYLNEHSFIREVSGYIPSEISMEVPVHDAQDVVPVEDVYPVYSENFPYWCRYMRVKEVTDNAAKGTVVIKGTVYLEEMYSDAKTDFIVAPGPVIQPPGPGTEFQQLEIASLTEGTHRDDEGVLKVSISGEITLP